MSTKSEKKLITLSTINKLKKEGKKFTCLTAYESTMASVISKSGVDIILVGDSLGMVIQGHDSTLPVTMERCEEELGVSEEVSSFVLPLGATINMDGTALYQAVAAVFIAQTLNMSLDISAQITIVLTTVLASIGTAAVPGAGIVMLVIILESVGVPSEGIAIILGVDRILDMVRTTVNVTGDATVSVIIAQSENQLKNIKD